MKILFRFYHVLLFLLVSWTVVHTFTFICLLLPTYGNVFLESTISFFWNVYLFGALDFQEYIDELSYFISAPFDPQVLHIAGPFFLYSLLMNGLAVYIWCNNQNPLSACFLAIAPCIAGPYLILLFKDYRVLIYGIIGVFVFYIILYNLNNYRKKHLPRLALPTWLEWRKPNLVPSIPEITKRFVQIFKK